MGVNTPSAETGLRPKILVIASIAVAVIATLAASAATISSTSFRDVYAGFGAELPPMTQIVLKNLWAWSLLALLAIGNAAWVVSTPVASRATFARMWVPVVALAVTTGAAMMLSIVALYLPIFRLGSVV
jgi:type II secretory pathway component PulF